ncbi:MAG: sodium:proton antiporter NhaD [Arenicella sp.]
MNMSRPASRLSCALLLPFLLLFPTISLAAGDVERLDLTSSGIGYFAIFIFVVAYLLVMAEEFLHLRKSKPVTLAAGIIWAAIAWVYVQNGMPLAAEQALEHNLLEFAELMLFLLVAMTYISAMEERGVFNALRVWLIKAGFSYRALFWVTGFLAFFISPVADNLTTALIMCSVVLAVGKGNAKFINIACINIVVAANAGGAFSPFGDITTLMVWQEGILPFSTFFKLLIPSLVNFIIPAAIMSAFIGSGTPDKVNEVATLKPGAKVVIALFLLTIVTAISFHAALHLPPAMGMMTGFAYLQFFGYFAKRREQKALDLKLQDDNEYTLEELEKARPFDVFRKVSMAEWDTLIFFFGVIMCVGGLGFIGYLANISEVMYTGWNHTYANAVVGVLSAIVDNIPVMFAVLTMNPEMSEGQWLLVTLTAGVGGSMLSVGSAAGVALMGQARGYYTFFGHLKWAPVIALGYIASILCHLWLNANMF